MRRGSVAVSEARAGQTRMLMCYSIQALHPSRRAIRLMQLGRSSSGGFIQPNCASADEFSLSRPSDCERASAAHLEREFRGRQGRGERHALLTSPTSQPPATNVIRGRRCAAAAATSAGPRFFRHRLQEQRSSSSLVSTLARSLKVTSVRRLAIGNSYVASRGFFFLDCRSEL